MEKKNKKNKGFTIIETLVVIVIIAILAGIVASSVGSSKIKAQNDKRLTDIRSYVQALQLYYFDNGNFPISTDSVMGCCLGYSIPTNNSCLSIRALFKCNDVNQKMISYFRSMPYDNYYVKGAGNYSIQGYVYIAYNSENGNCDNEEFFCDSFTLVWNLNKANQSCGIGKRTYSSTQYDYSTCSYTLTKSN